MYLSSSVFPIRRRLLLRGMAAGAGACLLASCGQEPSGTAGATDASPTPAPTRAVVVSTPLTAIPPRPVQLRMTIERGEGGEQLKVLGSLAFDAHGLLHVTERKGGDRVLVFDGAGSFVRSWGTHGSGDGQFLFDYDPAVGVSPIAIAADGTIYIGDTTGRVQAFDGGGRFLRKWGGPGGDSEVRRAGGLAIDGQNTLHVADADAHRIQMFDFGGRFLGSWGGPGAGAGQFTNPKGVTIDHEGNILVADEGNSRIQVFNRDRRFVRAIGGYGVGEGEMAKPGPRGVETDRRGDIYVTDKYHNRVQKFAPDGRFIIQWGGFGSQGDKLYEPNEVRVDASGDLWVADTYRILVFKQ